MSKAIVPILIGVAIIGAAFLTGGASLVPTLSSTITVGGVTATTVAAGGLAVSTLGGIALAAGAGLVLSGVEGALQKAPKVSLSQLDRLNASLDPTTPRKAVLGGPTAMNTDIRYVEPSGTNQEYIDYIICVASHAVESIDEIWFENTQGWTSAGGVTSTYAGYLTVNTVLEGSASNAIVINGGAGGWDSSCRLTGCAYVHLRIKRTGNSSSAQSPFSGGLNSRMTIIGKGAKVYDPRRDSTVSGGSGPMRITDQSTWAFTAADGSDLGNNAVLQGIWYAAGWKINGKLALGCGQPPARLDLADMAINATLCDEPVTLAAGGTQRRYQAAGILSEGDDPRTNFATIAANCNGRWRESCGKLSLVVMHNDLATALTDPGLTDADMIGPFTWDPDPQLEQTYNVVRGRYTDPSTNSLFQLVDYPEVRIASLDGIDRILTLDLPWIEDASRAQRMAKQVLERKQYQRMLTAPFGPRGWLYPVGRVVPVTLGVLGFDRRLFRVDQQKVQFNGQCPMALIEENDAIYAWDFDERPAVTPAAPIIYDRTNDPVLVTLVNLTTSLTAIDTDIASIVSDSILSKGEKPQVERDWAALYQNWEALDAKASALGAAATERANANTALSALSTYLGALTPAWNDATQDTAIVSATFQSKWSDATSATAALQAAIQGQPGTNALSVSATPAAITVACLGDGSPKTGEFPKYSQLNVLFGATDETASATYAATPSNCLASVLAGGFVQINSVSADHAYVDVEVDYSGISRVQRITLDKVRDGTPGTPGSSTARTPQSVSSTGTASAPASTTPITKAIEAGASIVVDGTLAISGTSATGHAYVKLYWAPSGSTSWTLLASDDEGWASGDPKNCDAAAEGTYTNSGSGRMLIDFKMDHWAAGTAIAVNGALSGIVVTG